MTSRDAAEAYLTMLEQHKRLGEELTGRTAAVCALAEAGLPHAAPLARLVEFLDEDLLPHVAWEERTLYPVAVRAGLVGAAGEMIAEHGALSAASARLAGDTGGTGGTGSTSGTGGAAAARQAREILALFTEHADKEDGILLRALLGHAGEADAVGSG